MMSVNREDYIVIGVDIGMDYYDDERCDEFDEYDSQNDVGSMTYIIDGMSGNYFLVGEVVRYGDEYEGFSGVVELEIDEAAKQRVKDFVKLKFDLDVEPKLMVVTHFH